MKFQIDNGQLFLISHNQKILLETKFINGDNQLDFSVQKIEKCSNEWIIHWILPEQATLVQIYTNSQTYSGFTYKFQLQVKAELTGIVQQTYGIKNTNTPYYMIPGYLYGSNNIAHSKGMQPQLNYRGSLNYPHTPFLFTRADRSTHNTVLTITQNSVLGLRVDESTKGSGEYYNGLGIDTRENDDYDRIAITLGYTHLPVWYRGKLQAASIQPPTTKGYLHLQIGEILEVTGHLYLDRANNRYDYEKVLVAFYQQIHQAPQPRSNQKEGIEVLAHALIHDAYQAKEHYFPSIVKVDELLDSSGDTAWTGGMQVIYPLAKAIPYCEEAKAVVVDYINELVEAGYNSQAHFFYESKTRNQWRVSGWWADDLSLYDSEQQKIPAAYSAYVNGQAVTYLLKTIGLINQIDSSINTTSWFEIAKEVLDHVIIQQREDGAFGTYYHADDGQALCYDSFQGAWVFAASAEMAKLTNDSLYLSACTKALAFYRTFIEKVEIWGMPIDAKDAVDEEGNLAFVTGLKTLHEITKSQDHLKLLEHCLHYECSWKFAYNTRFVNEPLKSMHWCSSGGSITSTHNIHIHPMGNLIVEELKYVYEKTNNHYFLQRLQDTLLWGLQSFNTKAYDFGFGKTGWATEQFFHSDAVQDDQTRIEDGGIWPDYLPWGAACILLSLCMNFQGVLPSDIANIDKEKRCE